MSGGRRQETRPKGPASRTARFGSDARQSESAPANDEDRVRSSSARSPSPSESQDRLTGQESGTSVPRQISRPEMRFPHRSVASPESSDVSNSGPPEGGAVRKVTPATLGGTDTAVTNRTDTYSHSRRWAVNRPGGS